jgi:two-component system phosphate regulon sensor histidine kinase PhoR
MGTRPFPNLIIAVILIALTVFFGFDQFYLTPEFTRIRNEKREALQHDLEFVKMILDNPKALETYAQSQDQHIIVYQADQSIIFNSRNQSKNGLNPELDFAKATQDNLVESIIHLPVDLGEIFTLLKKTENGYISISDTEMALNRHYQSTKQALLLWLIFGSVIAGIFIWVRSSKIGDRERRLADVIRSIGLPGSQPEAELINSPLDLAIEEQRERTERLLEEAASGQDKLFEVFRLMPEPVVICHPEGHIILANSAFRKVFPNQEEPEGQSLLEVIRNPILGDSLTGKELGSSSIDFQGRSYLVHTLRINDAGQRIVLFSDITRVKSLEQVRQDFVANASHELRTPLTTIYGYSETLLDMPLEPMAKQFVGMIHNNALRLNRIFNDLLTLSKIEAGINQTKKETISLQTALPAGLNSLEEKLAAKLITLQFHTTDVPSVYADPAALERILVNLVDNAILFSPTGGVIQISSSLHDGQPCLSVKDQGPGIEAKHHLRIFERFYCADPSHSKEHGGTGLGLAIVKHLVEMGGGRIWVESRYGEGANFFFTLPERA